MLKHSRNPKPLPRALDRPKPGRRRSAAALAAAMVVTTCAAVAPAGSAQGVSLGAGRAAISHFSWKVQVVTQASYFRLTRCASGKSGVTCQVTWTYTGVDSNTGPDDDGDTDRGKGKDIDPVLECAMKASTYSANGNVKVKGASPIKCKSLS